MRMHPMTAIVAVSALSAASCAHRADADPDASLVHDSDIDTRPSSDANLMGILLDHAETPRTIDEGFHLGTTVPILTMHFGERDEGCDELRSGANLGDVVELSVFVGGAGDVAPVAGTYPIPRQLDPRAIRVDANSAAVQVNAAPVGSVRAESGVVVVEAIDESLVTITLNAILEDGTPVRGRMTVAGECP